MSITGPMTCTTCPTPAYFSAICDSSNSVVTVIFLGYLSKIAAQKHEVTSFLKFTPRNLKRPQKLSCRSPAKTLGYIRGHGRSRPSNLGNNAKLIRPRKVLRQFKHQQDKFVRLLPDLQAAIVLNIHQSPVTNHQSLAHAP